MNQVYASLLIFGLFFVLERIAPKFTELRLLGRYLNAGILAALGKIIVHFGIPLTLVEFARFMNVAHGRQVMWLLGPESVLADFVTVLVLDLAIFGQHYFFHKIPLLWRLHRAHHTDHELDISTGIRFHPFEIYFSYLVKLLVIFICGASERGVFLFEALLFGFSIFTHANVKIPTKYENLLSKIFITPDLHRLHHYKGSQYQRSNLGFHLVFWDKLFKTFKTPLAQDQDVGVQGREYDLKISELLVDPFKR